jgi:L-ascorbate metabolism protein UlaG (beta-lactamase superfamily)
MRWKSLLTCAALSAVLWGCLPKPLPTTPGDPQWGVDIQWHGHSCFTFKDSIGRTIVIDPFDETVGYEPIFLKADALLISHIHFDHDNRRAVRARGRELELVASTGTRAVAGDFITVGIDSFHDKSRGELYGNNRIYSFTLGGLRLVHLGDFGQSGLTPSQKVEIGQPDVLFVPTGGFTTLGPKEAKALVDQIRPRVIIPMHYGDIRFYKLAAVKEFTDLFAPDQVKILSETHIRLRLSDLSTKPVVYVLKPANRNY